jgi:hypothetical protein
MSPKICMQFLMNVSCMEIFVENAKYQEFLFLERIVQIADESTICHFMLIF